MEMSRVPRKEGMREEIKEQTIFFHKLLWTPGEMLLNRVDTGERTLEKKKHKKHKNAYSS